MFLLAFTTHRPPSFWARARGRSSGNSAGSAARSLQHCFPLSSREREGKKAMKSRRKKAKRVRSIEGGTRKFSLFFLRPRKERKSFPLSRLFLTLSLSLSFHTYNDGERLWSYGFRWTVSLARKKPGRPQRERANENNAFPRRWKIRLAAKKKGKNTQSSSSLLSFFSLLFTFQNRCFPMWTDFSEVRTRACMLISGEREIRANELGLSLFLPVVGRRLLCSFFLSFFDLDTADVFSTSTSSKTKKKKTVHPRHRRPAQVQGPPRRLPRVPPPPEGDREAQHGIQGAEEGGRCRCREQGRSSSSSGRKKALGDFLVFSFFPPVAPKNDISAFSVPLF